MAAPAPRGGDAVNMPTIRMKPIRRSRVSIVIPAYNAQATIGQAVASCLAQTHPDCEVIVADDGSTDGTWDVVSSIKGVKAVRKPNGGVASARNAAVLVATGEYLAWMDADDVMHPERIALEVQVLRDRTHAVLVSTDFSAFRDGEPDYESSHIASYYRVVREAGCVDRLYDREAGTIEAGGVHARILVGRVYERLMRGNFVHFGTALVSRSAWERAGLLDESLRYGCEYDHLVRMARLGDFAYIDAPLLRYRRDPGQLSHDSAHGRMPLDTVAVLDKVRRDDPALARREARTFRARYAHAFLETSEMTVASDRARAAAFLARSLPFGPPPRDVSRIAAKIVLPASVVSLLKKALVRGDAAAASR